jgi:hypothetical protein
MNYEYLWNKTGRDVEIEKLENALAAFRYREAAPPVPAIVRKFAISSRFSFTRNTLRGFAFAASVLVVSIGLLVWFQIDAGETEFVAAPDVVFVSGPESPLADLPDQPPVKDIRISEPPAHRGRGRSSTINPTTASLIRRTKTKDAAPKHSVAALSEEERYAYRQLMLALSITGSKLKIVQDTIDGTEDTDDSSKNQR